MRYFVLVLLLGVAALAEEPKTASPAQRYTLKTVHDYNGIGKFYMDREIAIVMGHQGASWLERPEREKEEQPQKLLKILKIEPGFTVADIGAGSGYYAFRMAHLVGEKGKILAVDIQPEMIGMLDSRIKRDKITNVETVQSKDNDPKLKKESVDLIIMVDVYHEFSEPFEMTEKLIHALKPGGRLAFVEFRKEDPRVPIKEVHKMSEKQVLKEMAVFPMMKHDGTNEELPWQHVIFFKKLLPKK